MAPRLSRNRDRTDPQSQPMRSRVTGITRQPRRIRGATREALRTAIDVPHDISLGTATKLRQDFPGASPQELIDIASRRFIMRVSMESGAVGAAAAYPGAGTAVSATTSGVQLVTFVSEAALYTMTVAHLSGIDLRDPSKRTALVLAALLGRDGAEVISAQLGIQTVAWFRNSFLDIRTATAQQVNHLMARWLRRVAMRRAAASTLSRLIPFGVGAVVGWGIGRSMATSVIEGVHVALGPVPPAFAHDPVIVDIQVDGTPGSADRAYQELELPHSVMTEED